HRAVVVSVALAGGVRAIIPTGTTAASSRRAVEIAAQYEPVYAAVGIQPNYASTAEPGDCEAIEQLAASPKVVAIGETGLDRYWDYAPFDVQQDYFSRHIGLAQRLELPFVLPCPQATGEQSPP